MDESDGPDSPGDEEDARLVARILAMDREAEMELCRRFYSKALYMLRHRTHGSRVADDLCQDTFEIVLRKLRHEGLREPRRLAAYVLNTAHFVFIGWLRREARHPNDGGSMLAFLPASNPEPDLEHCRAERARAVRGLLQEMRVSRDREILFRRYVLEDRKERICKDLDLTEAHYDRVISRARFRFRDHLLRRGVNPDDLLPGSDET